SFRVKDTRSYGGDVQWLAARARLFDRRDGSWPREYRFGYRIVDDVGAQIIRGDTRVTVKRSADPVIIRPTESDLFVGRYAFEVELTEGRSRWKVDRTFEVEESGPPRGAALEKLLEPLSYISRPEEIRGIRDADSTLQVARWEAFWARRDPTPDTPRNEALIEFIRRVRHAERHFQGYGPGWRSDMGRIYIRYGPPDQVESRAAGSDTPQLEIWYYHNPVRTFVFGDREGFGRYTLMSPIGE
ncbi:MAG TPA: GWxTD domain-containing protein, partial [Acidimicrobiia bacterium]|nr:GWxTD domain-containing protein [Acidimicrobiia bacterium]